MCLFGSIERDDVISNHQVLWLGSEHTHSAVTHPKSSHSNANMQFLHSEGYESVTTSIGA